ncbi:hypothetical protein [Solibacillus sp. CAU 1738]|uniref:hypothetical protein n=1 Tax=Solibacillus sp. CAU 1738 TaxID=3140363 RepID=UPI003260577B
MRVNAISHTPDAYKQSQFYAGTHLVPYEISLQRAQVITEVEKGIFTRYLEKANGQRDMLTTSSTKEKVFLAQRNEHRDREELMQRLNYKNGVHFSVTNKIHFQEPI